MSWRIVVVRNRSKLELKTPYMVIRQEKTTRIHISEIAVLLIESTAVALTSALLCELIKQKIKVIFCDEKRNPISELFACYGSHNTSGKIRVQCQWDKLIKQSVWQSIIQEKIKNQGKLLIKLKKSEGEKILTYVEQVELGDITNREGHAAKVYFNALFGMEFARSQDIPTNAALNYGYALLLSAINREVVSLGYTTQLGINHDNQFNQFNLSCDLMEPFRILVDDYIFHLNVQSFESEEKIQVVDVLNKKVKIHNKQEQLLQAIKIYVKSVMDTLDSGDLSLLRFFEYEF